MPACSSRVYGLSLAQWQGMQSKRDNHVARVRSIMRPIGYCFAAGIIVWFVPDSSIATTTIHAQALTEAHTTALKPFEERLKQYIKVRREAQRKLPKLSSESQPAEIAAHARGLQANIMTARASAKPGEIFTTEVAGHIRSLIKDEFTGARLKALREDVLGSDVKGVPIRVNVLYPEAKELIEMPPTLLLKLPLLPKELTYRFVGRYLLLVDKEAMLIVDYMPSALP